MRETQEQENMINAIPTSQKLIYHGNVLDDQLDWAGSDDPRGILKEGKTYRVKSRELYRWATKYELKGFPGQKFNSVHFKEIPAGNWRKLALLGVAAIGLFAVFRFL